MKLRNTVVLVLVFGLLCVAYWWSFQHEELVEQREMLAKRLFDFEGRDVARLMIQQEDDSPTVGVCGVDGLWSITEPHPITANQELWERVAGKLSELMNMRTISETGEGLAEYELDQPRLTVSVATRSGEEHRIIFGGLDAYQKERYAQLDGGGIVLVSDTMYFELNRNLDLLRQMYLFREHKQGITRFEVAQLRPRPEDEPPPGPDTPEELRGAIQSIPVLVEWSDSQGAWWVVEPEEGPADQGMVQDLVQELQFLVGRDFVDAPESLSDYGLEPPRFRVTANIGDGGAPQTVYFGTFARNDEKGGIFVKREGEPAVFQVDAHLVTLLPPTPDALREKRLLSRDATKLTRLVYRAGDTVVALEDVPEQGWTLVEPVQEKADQLAVSRFIGALRELRGEKYFSKPHPGFGFEEPLIEIALDYEDEEETKSILIGAANSDGDRYYAKQDAGLITTLGSEAVAWLHKHPFYFRQKTIYSLVPDHASEAELVFEGTRYVFRMGSRKWAVEEPSGKAWDLQSDMLALLEALSDLRAVGVEADEHPADLAAYGLADPMLRWTATLKPGPADDAAPVLGPVQIGNPCADDAHARYALVPGRDELFRVDQAVIDDVREALRGLRAAS